jgi:DNA-binding HxlR family transcriptional regulator
VPLISRAVLVARLRELEDHGVVERRPRADGASHEYWLTPAGEGLRVVHGLSFLDHHMHSERCCDDPFNLE